MRFCLPICRAVVVLSLCAGALPCYSQRPAELGLDDIVGRMQAAQKESRETSYVVLREYRLFGSDVKAETSTVKAQVEYLAPLTKQFGIKEARGSERGEKIVRKVLEHESEMAAHPPAWELTPANYSFALAGTDMLRNRQCYVLALRPKRDTTELIRGKAWVDAETFLVARVEGEPAKNPSWWIKNLHLSMDYGQADGVWLTMQTRATADLRLLGRHTLTSRSVEVHSLTETASTRNAKVTVKPKAARRVSPPGAWVAH